MSSKDENEASVNAVLTKDVITSCLKADKGENTILKSFEVKDFTAIGDGLLTHVTSVLVDFQNDGHDQQISYVAKIYKRSSHTETVLLMRELFEKERGFYKDIAPALNEELRKAGLPALSFPRCLFIQSKKGEEVIFLEDLRQRGFKKYDRRQGLDEAHCDIVFKELARLHAASILLQRKSKVDLLESYPYLPDSFEKEVFPYESLKYLLASVIGGVGQLAEKMKGYEKVARYLQEVMYPQFMLLYREGLRHHPPFMVIVHTDCWVNNFLYRYSDTGVPEEAMIIDFQLVRRSSPTVDMMSVLHTSTTGDFRRQHKAKVIRAYYSVFQEVLQAGGLEPDFTLDELEKDYESRRMFGFLLGVYYCSAVLREDGKGFHIHDLDDENTISVADGNQEEIAQMSDDPVVRGRILSIFDEMMSFGVV